MEAGFCHLDVTHNAFIALVDDTAVLGKQESLTFMFFRLKRLCSLEWGGKCLSTSLRISLSILVPTCSL